MRNVSHEKNGKANNLLITIKGHKEVAEGRLLRVKMIQEHEAETKEKGQHIDMSSVSL